MRPSWDEDFETWATVLHHYSRRSLVMPVGWQRHVAESLVPPSGLTRHFDYERVTIGEAAGEWFRHDELDPSRVLLYLHGGGYSIGSVDSHRDLIARIARASGATAFALDYRRAPEHRFPAQLDDAVACYRWLLEQDVDPARLVVGGESAGGGLTLSLLVRLRDEGGPLPAAAVCISPWVDLEASSPSIRKNEPYDYVSRRVLKAHARRFVRRAQRREPLAAPLHADLSGLPPLLIHAGGVEAILDDATRIAERARAAGVEVELDVYDDMIHAWHLFARFFSESKRAIDEIGAFVRRHTETPGLSLTPRAQ